MSLPLPQFLRKSYVYRWLRAWYINSLYRKMHTEIKEETVFYRELGISYQSLVFDLGANKGYKTDVFLSLGAKVIAVEPDRNSFTELVSRFGLKKKAILLNEAVSDTKGTEEFFVLQQGSVLNTLSPKWKSLVEQPQIERFETARTFQQTYTVATTTLDNLIRLYGLPSFIKIDVEGLEFKVLSALSQAIDLLSFEANLPEFREETILCLQKIKSLNSNYLYNYAYDNYKFESKWMSFIEMLDFISTTELLYCEIFVRKGISVLTD